MVLPEEENAAIVCTGIQPSSHQHHRTSIASYRAEATFFKTVALSASKALGAIVPHAFWVHVDDRLGEGEGGAMGGDDGGAAAVDEAEVIKGLQESCFMMITGGWARVGGPKDRRACRQTARQAHDWHEVACRLGLL